MGNYNTDKTLSKRTLDVFNYIVALTVSSLSGFGLSHILPMNAFISILYYFLFWFWWSRLAKKK